MRRVLYALGTLLVFVLDQASKAGIRSRLASNDSLTVVSGLFHLTLVTNRGALFGLFRDLPDPFRAGLFTVVPALAIALILYFQIQTSLADTVAHWGLALILGGALGNLSDRLRLGHVIDFLDFFLGTHHWPAFNLADSAICVGVGLLALDLVRGRRHGPIDPPTEA
ncbi:MAG TPA: signal peptidase II [Candidatus Polarisedimenticolia bacterium]|nr:signal peptidase II [Candidatus Polarisedimenticolia bacterium]